MALFGNVDENYTRTGKGTLTRWANALSYIPNIPILTGSFKFALGMVDSVIEAGQWLFRGKLGSAATALIAGTVGNGVNALTSEVLSSPVTWFLGNAGSGIATGETLGTHARALTENIIGGITGALGSKPQVLSSYTAGIGSIGDSAIPQGPGKFSSSISAQRGEDANMAYERFKRGDGGAHINELQSAYGRGA